VDSGSAAPPSGGATSAPSNDTNTGAGTTPQ
jgi:hypothetical protein